MSNKYKIAGIATSAALLVAGSGVALAAGHANQVLPLADQPAKTAEATDASTLSVVTVKEVQGTFTFSQDVVTPISQIKAMFNKAAAAMCASLPCYQIDGGAEVAVHFGDETAELSGSSFSDRANGNEVKIVGCACSSNIPGGGAIINAEVSGVPISQVAAMVGAL